MAFFGYGRSLDIEPKIDNPEKGIGPVLIIEALGPNAADQRAEEIGLDFDKVYGPDHTKSLWFRQSERYFRIDEDQFSSLKTFSGYIHYLDGSFQPLNQYQLVDRWNTVVVSREG